VGIFSVGLGLQYLLYRFDGLDTWWGDSPIIYMLLKILPAVGLICACLNAWISVRLWSKIMYSILAIVLFSYFLYLVSNSF
jgi:hypothetical protein